MQLSIFAESNRLGFCEGVAWDRFKEVTLKDVTYELIDVDHPRPPLGERILLMGQRALSIYGRPGADIFKTRGALLRAFNRHATCTFDLQRAFDYVPEDEHASDTSNSKDTTSTQKKNWLFWIDADTKKLLNPAAPVVHSPKYIIRPGLSEHIQKLTKLRGRTIYLDIETDMASDTLTVIGFAVDNSPIFVVPVFQFDHTLSYDRTLLFRFMAALSTAFQHNTVVVHNAMFDLAYLATHYRLPFGPRIFDTMLAHKRCFSEIEKSLGHAISYWTWQPYHKDTNTQVHNRNQQQLMYEYNAKDVFAMRLVHLAQLEYLRNNPAIEQSVAQANSSLYPYLLAGLTGFRIDKLKLSQMQLTSRQRMNQLIRVIRILTNDKKFNPDSPKQIVKYFHETLCYKVVERTDAGAPSLGGKAMYVLALKYPNPLIPIILHYREVQKESVMCSFHEFGFPWNEHEHAVPQSPSETQKSPESNEFSTFNL